MPWWGWLLIGLAVLALAIIIAAFVLRFALKRTLRHPLMRRTAALPLRDKLSLAARLWRDRRVPWPAKLLLPLLIVYLALPLDLIPDFIPVIGYLDDAAILLLIALLLLRVLPRDVIEEHLAALESKNNSREIRNKGARDR